MEGFRSRQAVNPIFMKRRFSLDMIIANKGPALTGMRRPINQLGRYLEAFIVRHRLLKAEISPGS